MKITHEEAMAYLKAYIHPHDNELRNYITQQEKAEKLFDKLDLHYEEVDKLNDTLIDLSIVAHRIFAGTSVDITSDRLKYNTLRDEVIKELEDDK